MNFHQPLNLSTIMTNMQKILYTLPENYRPLSDFCQYETNYPETVTAWKEASLLCEEIASRKKPRRWLSLLGVSGVGKTMLAKAIKQCSLANRPQMTASFFRWSTIVNDYLRKGEFDIMRFLIHEVDVLLIDDIGLETGSEFSHAKLCELLDARLEKWTVITSNLSLEDIKDRIDVRIASRMLRGDSVIVQMMNCPDWSFEKYKQRIARMQ